MTVLLPNKTLNMGIMNIKAILPFTIKVCLLHGCKKCLPYKNIESRFLILSFHKDITFNNLKARIKLLVNAYDCKFGDNLQSKTIFLISIRVHRLYNRFRLLPIQFADESNIKVNSSKSRENTQKKCMGQTVQFRILNYLQ